MLIIPPPRFRKRRARPKRTPPQPGPPPVALVLVGASFDEGYERLTLTFDRAIDFAGLDGTQIILDDDDFSGNRYDGSGGATPVGANGVRIQLIRIDSTHQSGVHLTASASTGIVAVDDGGTWAGVSDLVLPFP